MKKKGFLYFLAGALAGALVFGAAPAIASGVTAMVSNQPVKLDGNPVQITAYSIAGNNYFKLRDLAAVMDFGVWFDDSQNTVMIESGKGYDANYSGSGGAAGAQRAPDRGAAGGSGYGGASGGGYDYTGGGYDAAGGAGSGGYGGSGGAIGAGGTDANGGAGGTGGAGSGGGAGNSGTAGNGGGAMNGDYHNAESAADLTGM